MFISPCTLRSAQCAALIALAAAGIDRTPAEGIEGASADYRGAVVKSCPTPDQRPASWFGPAMTPWLQSIVIWFTRSTGSAAVNELPASGLTDDGNAENHATGLAAPVLVPPPFSTVPFAPDSALHLGPGSHRWPHAVGPPAALRLYPPNAVGTVMPGDSTADGKTLLGMFRITPVDAVSSLPRLARLRVPPRNSAGPAVLLFAPARRYSASRTLVPFGVFATADVRSFPCKPASNASIAPSLA